LGAFREFEMSVSNGHLTEERVTRRCWLPRIETWTWPPDCSVTRQSWKTAGKLTVMSMLNGREDWPAKEMDGFASSESCQNLVYGNQGGPETNESRSPFLVHLAL
jgi:hypothetical protein